MTGAVPAESDAPVAPPAAVASKGDAPRSSAAAHDAGFGDRHRKGVEGGLWQATPVASGGPRSRRGEAHGRRGAITENYAVGLPVLDNLTPEVSARAAPCAPPSDSQISPPSRPFGLSARSPPLCPFPRSSSLVAPNPQEREAKVESIIQDYKSKLQFRTDHHMGCAIPNCPMPAYLPASFRIVANRGYRCTMASPASSANP